MRRNALHWALWAALGTGCVAQPDTGASAADAIVQMLDSDTSADRRTWALHEARRIGFDHPERVAALKTLVHERRFRDEDRCLAVDHLIEADPDAARQWLDAHMPQWRRHAVIDHVLGQAAERRWRSMSGSILRLYSRPSKRHKENDRPEGKALTRLYAGRCLDQILQEALEGRLHVPPPARVAAWAVFCRRRPEQADQRRFLSRMRSESEPLPTLRTCLRQMNLLPTHPAEVDRAYRLRLEHPGIWKRMQQAVEALNDRQRKGLRLAHLPTVLAVFESNRSWLGLDRQEHRRLLDEQLAGAEHHHRNPETPHRLDDRISGLCWADLISVRLLREVVFNPRHRRYWFHQADADLSETDTERGGLVWAEPRGPRQHPPRRRIGDHRYLPPVRLHAEASLSLAHYHLHAQRLRNGFLAGPGPGDFDWIESQQLIGLTLCRIDRHRLNVDWYRAGNLQIDLGTLQQPLPKH